MRMKKIIIIPILILALLGPVLAPFAESFSFPDRYDLVAILVEQGLYEDPEDYDGLFGKVKGPLSRTTIKERVDRYAIDLQNALPGTRSLVIQVDRFERPENITAVLERLYFEGDPKEPNRIAYLKGVVIIGEVPLPVVHKEGNRFISLFPYTDFEQKVYVWNSVTSDFEFDAENPNPQPEIWHGVVRPPLGTDTPDSKKLLAAYFDKNHLYHIGDPAYTTFDKKIFFQDFFHERKNLNPIAYKNYLNFLEHQDDIAYLRYTKKLYQDLTGASQEDFEKDLNEAKELQEELEKQGIPFDSFVPKPDLPENAPQAVKDAVKGKSKPVNPKIIPDILTKVSKMSDNLMFRFHEVFTKYPNLINDFIKYTGRYTDVDSAVNLITAKDQFTIGYLKAVNSMVEQKIDEIAKRMQKNISFTQVKVEVTDYTRELLGKITQLPALEVPLITEKNNPEFLNFSPAYDNFPSTLNGYLLENISGVAACTPYFGSKGIGKYSKAVEFNRALNDLSAVDSNGDVVTGRTPAERDKDYKCYAGIFGGNCEGYKHFAGCFYDAFYPYETLQSNEPICFPDHATDPVFDPAGTREVQSPPQNFDNFRSCMNFYEKEKFVDYLKSIDVRLDGLDYRADTEKKAAAFAAHQVELKEKQPDDIKLFASKVAGDSFEITMGDILRAFGWDPKVDPSGFREALIQLVLTSPHNVMRSVNFANHPKVLSAKFKVERLFEKTISSIMYHKEPTTETLVAQAQALISKDLPVDNPRYLTFQNQAGGVSRITYPDLFKEDSFESFEQTLEAIEKELNALPRFSSIDPPPCNNCLRGLFSVTPEIAKTEGTETILERANSSKVLDALNWKNMDIDTKHTYLTDYYLNPSKNPYIGKAQNGYEMLYLNGEGESDYYAFSVNVDLPEDSEAKEAKQKADLPSIAKEAPYENEEENPFDEEIEDLSAEGSYDLISFSPPPISPWFEKMKEWARNLKQVTTEFQFGKKQEEFYGDLKEGEKQLLEEIKKESSNAESLYSGSEVDFSLIASIHLETDSSALVGGKKAEVRLTIRDKKGNPVNDEFVKVTLTLNGAAHFSSDLEDENRELPGYQITLVTGTKTIGIVTDLLTSDIPSAAITLHAQLEGLKLAAELKLTLLAEARLVLESASLATIADGKNVIPIEVSARDSGNQILAALSGTVNLAVSDPLMGKLSVSTLRLQNGKASASLTVLKKSGKLAINATNSAIDSGSLTLQLLPGPPTHIRLSSESETLPALPGSDAEIQASLYDTNGNMVDTNSSAEIKFRLSKATSQFGNLSTLSEKVQNGVATTRLSPREETGTITIIAESNGLLPDVLTIKSVKQFSASDIAKGAPDALTVALLGIPAGDVAQDNYLGSWFTMQGRVQAAASLTTTPKQFMQMFQVNEQGAIRIADPNRVSAHFLPANNFTLMLRDEKLRTDLAEVSIVTQKEGEFDITDRENPKDLADGIYLRKVIDEEMYQVDRVKGALRLLKSENEKLEVQTNGFIRIFDNDITIRPRDADMLIVEIFDKDTLVAEVFFVQHFNQDVRFGPAASEIPGVSVRPLKAPPNIRYRHVLTGNSSSESLGLAFYDTSEEVRGTSAPGFSFLSLEDSLDRFGVGFTQDNKFGLLFSSGETFGEAHRLYSSDIGIILGDPTVRIDNRAKANETFSQDVGKLIYAGDAEVQSLLSLDYQSDGFEDILVIQDDGRIRLLQNNGGYDQFRDQGYILNIKNGIQDATKLDFNRDGQMDLVIAGTVSCRKGDTCIDIYENQRGAFMRKNLQFDQIEKIITARAEDLNRDSFPDLVLADSAGDIRVLYNRGGQFDTQAQVIGNVGLQIDPVKNLVTSVLLRYPGMTTKNPLDPASTQMYYTLSLPELNPSATQEGFRNFFAKDSNAEVSVEEAIKYVERDFIYADLDASAFANSTKFAEDLNGGIVKAGDKIRYTITLKNDSAAVKRDVSVSDVISDQLEFDLSSIQCRDCAKDEMETAELSGDPTRPYLFRNITVPARSARHIVYEAEFAGNSEDASKITFIFSDRFEDPDANLNRALRADDFPDIAVTKEGNPTGRVRYFYTTSINAEGTLVWSTELSSPPKPKDITTLNRETGLNFPKPEDFNRPTECFINGKPQGLKTPSECRASGGTPEPPQTAKNTLSEVQSKDSDRDGLPDSIDDINGTLDNLAQSTSQLVSKLTCSGGCIALPMNVALLAPGFFSVLGIPAGFDIGTPVFGWGAPGYPPIYPPQPALATQGGRIYVSPTLTGGIGFSVCLGTYGTSKNCYSFGINPLDLISPGLCDKISGALGEALASVNDVVSSVNEGTVLTIPSSQGTTGAGSRRASGSGLGNYSLGSYESSVTKSRNIRVPGFPSVITDWWARQMEEFTDKVLNLPDIYLIYPDPSSIVGAFKPTQKFSRTGNLLTNILSWLNSFPILDIETQEVLFKIPTLTRQEIERFKADARQWISDEQLELSNFRNLLGCGGKTIGAVSGTSTPKLDTTYTDPAAPEICRIVTVDLNNFITSLSENMRALDEWILFPKKLLEYRAIESYYLSQIIDYLDTIIQYSGGWMKKNTARIKEWKRAIREIRNVIKTWKGLVDLMVDYNESCDKCKTERFSLKDLILKLFIALPAPPVIPLPKLPDFVIDVSRVQAGLRIMWPDIKFKAEPLTLPRLPRLSLTGGVNLNAPLFKASLPSIPVIPKPPELPELPALPKLNLPKLPDIPPPPKLPGLPRPVITLTAILKKVVKILCIIRLGFTPTDETLLKARIEEITARGLDPVLPIDTLFTIQSPTISVSYVDQLRVTAFTNLQLQLDYIQKLAEAAANKSNSFVTDLTKSSNTFKETLSRQIEKSTSPSLPVLPSGPEGRQLNYKENLTRELSEALGSDATELVDYGLKLRDTVQSLATTKDEYEKLLADVPDTITLKAETEPFVSGASAKSSYKCYSVLNLIQDNSESRPCSKHEILNQVQDDILPFQRKLKEYRDQLALYTDDTQKMIESKDFAEDLGDFRRFIANQARPFIDTSLKKYLASSDPQVVARHRLATQNTSEPQKVGSLDLENIDWLKDGDNGSGHGDKRFLAQLPPIVPTPDVPPGPTIQNVGIFFIAPDGQSKRLVNYTLEAEKTSRLADIDIEGDGDLDKLYSYGPNVFLKRNERILEKEERPTFRSVDIEFWTVFELLPKGMSPNFPVVLSEATREASFSFKPAALDNLAGFEVIAKNSPFFFENPVSAKNSITLRAHLLPDTEASLQIVPLQITIEDSDGEVLVNSAAVSSLTLEIGDYIETGENGSVTLRISDSTLLRVSPNTGFKLNQGGTFELSKGNLEVEMPKSGSRIFPPSTVFRASEGSLRLRFFDGSETIVTEETSFILPELRSVTATLGSLSGSSLFIGQKRDYIQPRSGKVRLKAGEIIHPLEVVRIKWQPPGSGAHGLTLSQNVLLPIPNTFANGIDIEMEDGIAEIIRIEQTTQPAASGMALTFGDELKVTNGSAVLHYDSGGSATIRSNERYTLNKIESLENPTISLLLDPAFYFAKIYAFDKDGNHSNASEKLLLAPQVCGDTVSPVANLGQARFTVALGKTREIDASRSFDAMSNIISYTLDIDTAKDSNGDSIPTNDSDIKNHEVNSPKFTLGPYEQVGQKKMRLTVRDEAMNEGYQDITVDVITPRIVLEAPPLGSNVISGYVDPPEENVPITIARLRPGTSSVGWEIFKTPSADPAGQYFTNADGKFRIEDLDLRDRLVVRNNEGIIVAEVNKKTGRITIIDERYEKRVMPLVEPMLSLRIGVFLKNDPPEALPLTYVYFVPDVNTDTTIDAPEVLYNSDAFERMSGVHIKPLQKASGLGLSFKVLPLLDLELPGATVISFNGRRVASLDVNGDLLLNDKNITVSEKGFSGNAQQLANQPVIFELLFFREPIAEIFIAILSPKEKQVQIIDAPVTARIARPKVTQPFTDIRENDPFAKTAFELFKRGIIAGYPSTVKGHLFYKPENLINRAEFTQITLKLLCIIPREEAYQLPSPFYDVLDPKLWFYPVLKEGNIRAFIRGYLGEEREDLATGVKTTPFKPQNYITRAEAATILLAALQEQDVIDLSKVNFSLREGGQWYDPYIEVAQDLKPYIKDPQDSGRAFLITKEEASSPDKRISRKDFAIMTERALLFYDCYKTRIAGISGEPGEAEEKDRSLSPGLFGGKLSISDQQKVPEVSNEEGVFILRPSCISCPCQARIGEGSDLASGDFLFAAITGKGGLPIYAKSNEEKY